MGFHARASQARWRFENLIVLDARRLAVRSGTSLLAVETRDEERVAEIVQQVAGELALITFEWSVTAGLAQA